jgi:hypothetical protein
MPKPAPSARPIKIVNYITFYTILCSFTVYPSLVFLFKIFVKWGLNILAVTEVLSWHDFFNSEGRDKTVMTKSRPKLVSTIKGMLAPTAVLTVLALPLIGAMDGGYVHALASNVIFGGVINSDALVATANAVVVNVETVSNPGWDMLIHKVLWITDFLMDGVIIFSGISWMFGNRTKAIELLFSSGIGYIIVRHHEDIKRFFALI